MPNPFPGVNPFVEAAGLWPGFHNLFVGDCSRLLNRVLKPRGYAAYVEERVELVDLPDGDEGRRPDIAILDRDVPITGPVNWPDDRGGTALLDIEPVTVVNPAYELLTIAYVEVRYVPNHELVTSIELLSPSNKGRSRGGYDSKRRSVLATEVNLVELDLLLGGLGPEVIGRLPPGDFRALISRGDRRPECQVYSWSIRQRLPRIAIPLRPTDGAVTLDLAAAYSMSYDDGPYDVTAMYDMPLAGSLSGADQAWVAERVAGAEATT